MRQIFGGGDESHRHLAAVRPGKLAQDAFFILLVPWQSEAAGGKFLVAGQIKERGEERFLFDGAQGGDLRNRQHGLFVATGFPLREFEIGKGAVGGAKVNANGVGGHGKTGEWAGSW